MVAENTGPVTLAADDLNDWDRRILDYLASDGRATPSLLVAVFADAGHDTSRQWINARLVRLAEHGHVRNVRDSGVYELTDDPRDA